VSEVDGGGMAGEVEPPHQYSIRFVAVQQMAAEGQSDKLTGADQGTVQALIRWLIRN